MLWINYFWTLPWKKLWSTSQIWWQKCFKQGYECFYGHWHEVKLGPEANLTSFWKSRKPNCYLAGFKTKNFDKLSLMAKKYWMILFTMTRLPWKISLVVTWHHVNHRVVAQNDQIATLKTMTEAAKQILDHILVWFTNLRTDKFEYVTS